MDRIRSTAVTAMGAIAVIVGPVIGMLHRPMPSSDQPTIASYLSPPRQIEPESIGRLRAPQFRLADARALGGGSNTVALAGVARGRAEAHGALSVTAQ